MLKDEELIKRIKNGNIMAFEELIRRYKGRVYAIIFNIIKKRDEVEDLVQETFLRMYENLEKFRGDSSFYTWLYRISVNVALSYLRKIKMNLEFMEEIGYLEGKDSIDERIANRELVEEIFKEANSLPKKEKLVFILKYKNNFSNKEISEILGISRDSVKANLYHALKRIRKRLVQKGFLGDTQL